MGNADKKTQAAQRAFLAELQMHLRDDDITPLLTFFVKSFTEIRAGQVLWFGVKILTLVFLAFLAVMFSDFPFKDSPEQIVAFALIPVLSFYVIMRSTVPLHYPFLVSATTETLLVPLNYSPEQKRLIAALVYLVPNMTAAEESLRQACQKALQRSA